MFVHDGSFFWNCFQFSASPGRFFLTDIQSSPDGQLVEIKAEFPWGSETVETVRYTGTKLFENTDSAERELFEVYQLYLSKHPLTFKQPTFSCANECKNLPLKFHFMYSSNKEVY